MPADIRNFFGAKGSQGSNSSSAPTSNRPKAQDAPQSRKRRNRKVVDDSEDEEVEVNVPSTPKAQPKKKKQKAEEPTGEPTTTSDYFASSRKGRPPKKETKRGTTPESATPEKKTRSSPRKPEKRPEDDGNGRTGGDKASPTAGRKKKSPRVSRIIDDDDNLGGDDIFATDFQKPGKGGGDDDYQEDESDFEEMVVEPRKAKPTTSKKDTAKSNGQKRKSDALAEDEDDEYDQKPKKPQPRKSPQKPSSKKPRQAKTQEPESKEIQKIFDDIPTVRPPTPPAERKKFNFATAAQHTQPPPGAGTKDIPVGAPNCLAGLSFVFTGILDTIGREEGQGLVKRYGGKVPSAPSSKTNYVVLGNEAGPKKLDTIRKYNIKTINEDGLFELIRRLPANGGDGKAASQYEAKKKAEEERVKEMAAEIDREEKKKKKGAEASSTSRSTANSGTTAPAPNGKSKDQATVDNRLWTTKYSPTSLNMVCGNKAPVEKLQSWLRNWRSSAKSGFKKPGKDGTGLYRAVMIHGPPGIGKTTAAHLVARLEDYDVLETNASDTRSKKLLEEGLRGVLDTTSLQGYFAGEGKKIDSGKKKMMLVMDEVDGMSAGDRGGVGALAAVAKKTQIPMILICNERRLPKMRPFDKIVYEMPFRRPTADQIRARLSTICFREGLKIPPQVLDGLIEGTHADIRQVINMLSTIKLDSQNLSYDEGKEMSKSWEKHVILKPWDIAGKILSAQMFSQSSTATLNDKIELYFNDHEFSYLMVQENYLKTNPVAASAYGGRERQFKLLELADNAAESISDGDLVDRTIHGSQQQWGLMPTHAVFSFVRPASFVAGNLSERVGFTSWLGNNSKQGKMARQVKEIQGHMRLRASGDRHEIRQQYMPALWDKLVRKLEVEGKDSVEAVIDLLDSYFLTRDDWDSIVELGLGPMADKNVTIDSATKATFTRLYNQRSHPLPFMKASSVVAPKKVPKPKPDLEDAIDESDEGEEVLGEEEMKGDNEEGSDLDLKKDKYVKAPKKKGGNAAGGKASGAKAKPKSKPKPKKGKKAKDDDEDEEDDDILSDSEDEKPKKGRKGRKPKGKKA